MTLYTSRLIKATALIADTKALLASWDLSQSVPVNLDNARRSNIFGKASRSRVQDILKIFRQRYFEDPEIGRALVTLVQNGAPSKWVDPILYYYSVQNDLTLRDIVLDVVNYRRQAGFTDVHLEHVKRKLREWSSEGKTTSAWGDDTTLHVAQHALATLRDFGILEGANQKYIVPVILPIEPFAFIGFDLLRKAGSGDKVRQSPEWGLFYLSPNEVEQHFIEAHQQHLLEYYAAGSVIRLEYPTKDLVELAHALVERIRA